MFDEPLRGKLKTYIKVLLNLLIQKIMNYYVQETIGGWRQNAVFEGTLEECQNYYNSNHLYTQCGWSIVSEEEYEVDYL